jgi:prepilin peptidase CpaA
VTHNIHILSVTFILLIAVITDVRYKKIPNILTFSGMIIAIGYHSLVRGLDGIIFSMEGLFLGMALLIAFYFAGGMGAGDVKLMGAIGGFLGPKGVFDAFLFSAIVGGIYAMVILQLRGHLIKTFKRYALIIKMFAVTGDFSYVPESRENIRNIKLCYGVAIALGTMFSIFIKKPF